MATIPDCQGLARFDSKEQAEYVANGHSLEFGNTWKVMPHGDHYHVIEIEDDIPS